MDRLLPQFNNAVMPLVSITLHNYNYGRYLRECLDSLMGQGYPNLEICFSDNSSTDDSWEIALEYQRRYPGIMNVTCNRQNFGSGANWNNCAVNARGKYLLTMCSDDVLMPNCLEICVQMLEKYSDAGFIMFHRSIVDECGTMQEEPPFYNRSCLIPGSEQAAVYMMASVNPSISQVMYNRQRMQGKISTGGIATQWYGSRILDFNICCEYPIAYLSDPLMLHRVHGTSDSSAVFHNLIDVIGPYVLQHQFADIAAHYGNTKVVDRLPTSIQKAAKTALRYSARALCAGDERLAARYLNLSRAIHPEIAEDTLFGQLEGYWKVTPGQSREYVNQNFAEDNLLSRAVSYDPPPGSLDLSVPAPVG